MGVMQAKKKMAGKKSRKSRVRKLRVLKDLQFVSPTVFKYKGTYFQVLKGGKTKRLGQKVEVLLDGRIKITEKTGVKILKPKKLASPELKRIQELRKQLAQEKQEIEQERESAKSAYAEARRLRMETGRLKREMEEEAEEVKAFIERKLIELEEREEKLKEQEQLLREGLKKKRKKRSPLFDELRS